MRTRVSCFLLIISLSASGVWAAKAPTSATELPGPPDQESVFVADTGLFLTVPRHLGFHWKTTTEGLHIQNTWDSSLNIRLSLSLRPESFHTIPLAELARELEPSASVEPVKVVELNGMKGETIEGWTMREGVPCFWSMTRLESPGKDRLLMVSRVSQQHMVPDSDVLEEMAKSLRPQYPV